MFKVRCVNPGALSSREVEVVILMISGYVNKKISCLLGISTRTVNIHLRHVYSKLGLTYESYEYSMNPRVLANNILLDSGMFEILSSES